MKDPESLSKIFETTSLQGLRQIVEGANLVQEWEKVIKEPIASETRALKYLQGILYVEVTSSVWANELTFLKSKIIETINKKNGKEIVKDIRFLVKGVKLGEREQ